MAGVDRRGENPRRDTFVAFGDCRNLTVTAVLQQGAVLDEQWPQTLDGILAGIARRIRLGPVYGTEPDHHIDALPLAKAARHKGPWHWMATCARPVGASDRELHWWHSRFDEARAGRIVSNLPPVVRPNQGRYRSYRSPLVVTVAGALEWRVVGQAEPLRELLAHVWCVGKKHAQGEGAVVRWEVTDEGPPVDDWAGWWEDGRVARPVTARLAPAYAPSADIVMAALRPPYFQGKQLREALAPWTVREEVTAMVDSKGGGSAP